MIRSDAVPRCNRGTPSSSMSKSWPISSRSSPCASATRSSSTRSSSTRSSPGASPSPGTRSTSSTSGSTRCSTTTRRCPTHGRRGPHGALLAGEYHVIGKDILKFHWVFWPAMLMAAGLPVPEHVFVHGYLLMDGEKMSKSLGNVLDPFVVMDRFGTDALRFYCFRDVSFGQDGSSRRHGSSSATRPSWPTSSATSPAASTNMVARYRDGVVPEVELDPALAAAFDAARPTRLRPARPRRDHAGARGDLGTGAAAERLRGGDRALDSWPRTPRAGEPRPRARLADRGRARRRCPAAP